MRIIPLLLVILLVPLEGSGMEFIYRDIVPLTDINGITSGRLGWAVGVNRGAVFMGAPDQDFQAGATYEYRINDQRQLDFVSELEPQDDSPRLYGSAIITEGEVTAISYGSRFGIELFTLKAGNWVFSKWLEPPAIDNVTFRNFGSILDVSGEFLVVGAPGAQQVYVFSHVSGLWREEQKILPPEGLDFFNADFGFDVDYHNGSLVVGSNKWNDIDGNRAGAVFLYEDPGIGVCGALDGIYCDSYESN